MLFFGVRRRVLGGVRIAHGEDAPVGLHGDVVEAVVGAVGGRPQSDRAMPVAVEAGVERAVGVQPADDGLGVAVGLLVAGHFGGVERGADEHEAAVGLEGDASSAVRAVRGQVQGEDPVTTAEARVELSRRGQAGDHQVAVRGIGRLRVPRDHDLPIGLEHDRLDARELVRHTREDDRAVTSTERLVDGPVGQVAQHHGPVVAEAGHDDLVVRLNRRVLGQVVAAEERLHLATSAERRCPGCRPRSGATGRRGSRTRPGTRRPAPPCRRGRRCVGSDTTRLGERVDDRDVRPCRGVTVEAQIGIAGRIEHRLDRGRHAQGAERPDHRQKGHDTTPEARSGNRR